MACIRIGTSGWIYRSWRGPFYPEALGQSGWLAHYATVFDTIELNGTFYRQPEPKTVERWRTLTPDGFCFAWKASRFITHMKRLLDPGPSLERLLPLTAALGPKAGPVLFQLPPSLKIDLGRFDAFLAELPREPRAVVEFRHPSWFTEPVFRRLSDAKAALCISDHHHAPTPWVATTDFLYVRGHGPAGRYAGSYGDGALAVWAERLGAERAQGKSAFVYFDNDIGAAAPADARRLKCLVDGAMARPYR